jgi:hypothetical protein
VATSLRRRAVTPSFALGGRRKHRLAAHAGAQSSSGDLHRLRCLEDMDSNGVRVISPPRPPLGVPGEIGPAALNILAANGRKLW